MNESVLDEALETAVNSEGSSEQFLCSLDMTHSRAKVEGIDRKEFEWRLSSIYVLILVSDSGMGGTSHQWVEARGGDDCFAGKLLLHASKCFN